MGVITYKIWDPFQIEWGCPPALMELHGVEKSSHLWSQRLLCWMCSTVWFFLTSATSKAKKYCNHQNPQESIRIQRESWPKGHWKMLWGSPTGRYGLTSLRTVASITLRDTSIILSHWTGGNSIASQSPDTHANHNYAIPPNQMHQ